MDILSTILTNTYTIQDLRRRVRLLKSHLENIYFGHHREELSPEDSSWISSLSDSFVSEFNKDNIHALFNSLEDQIKKLNPLVIYLAFEPGQEQIEQIGFWVKKNLTQPKVFEIKIDPALLGGAALVNGGVYKDYSLRSKIGEQGETILAEFKKYIR
ncbi:MAG: Uncharacterized protein CEO21_129 [Microgenomates group bacterium Gr01-1014_80]|nr:MAG: Uncharacterized protein CEO21_129 [Microgenomates group bacterium Gr01-1014_80]